MNMFEQPKTILLTSVGNEAIHGFVEDLRRRAPRWTLIGVDMREDAAGRFVCDRHFTVPRRDDERFLPQLRHLIAAHAVDLVVPLSTEDQDWFCRPEIHAALAPAAVMTSSASSIAVANRKTALFAHLADAPQLLPDHRIVGSADEALSAVSELLTRHTAVLLKSDASTGGRGMVCIGEPTVDLAPAAGRAFIPRDVWNELSTSSPAMRAMCAPSVWSPRARWPQLLNAYLPGLEYSVDVLADSGRVLSSVVRRRDAATGGLALTSEVVDAPDVENAAARVVERVGLSYVANIQFRRDARGVPRLMEINPRLPGTIGLTVASGLNLPLLAMGMALGETPGTLPSPRMGVQCFRFHGMVLSDAGDPI